MTRQTVRSNRCSAAVVRESIVLSLLRGYCPLRTCRQACKKNDLRFPSTGVTGDASCSREEDDGREAFCSLSLISRSRASN